MVPAVVPSCTDLSPGTQQPFQRTLYLGGRLLPEQRLRAATHHLLIASPFCLLSVPYAQIIILHNLTNGTC